MPFLSYETFESFGKMTAAIQNLQDLGSPPSGSEISLQERLAKAYMSASNPGRRWRDPPLRIQRTLDQFLDPLMEDTRNKDFDQLVLRAARQATQGLTRGHTEGTLAVVDQMLLWTDGSLCTTRMNGSYLTDRQPQ